VTVMTQTNKGSALIRSWKVFQTFAQILLQGPKTLRDPKHDEELWFEPIVHLAVTLVEKRVHNVHTLFRIPAVLNGRSLVPLVSRFAWWDARMDRADMRNGKLELPRVVIVHRLLNEEAATNIDQFLRDLDAGMNRFTFAQEGLVSPVSIESAGGNSDSHLIILKCRRITRFQTVELHWQEDVEKDTNFSKTTKPLWEYLKYIETNPSMSSPASMLENYDVDPQLYLATIRDSAQPENILHHMKDDVAVALPLPVMKRDSGKADAFIRGLETRVSHMYSPLDFPDEVILQIFHAIRDDPTWFAEYQACFSDEQGNVEPQERAKLHRRIGKAVAGVLHASSHGRIVDLDPRKDLIASCARLVRKVDSEAD
jgi:hypothetical protein